MKHWILSLSLLLLVRSLPAAEIAHCLTPEELEDGWISLFDGESLYGWRPAGKADFKVVDGAITVNSGEVCLLRTTTQFSDYVLKVDFRCEPDTNSGVFLRTSPDPKDVKKDCYELNIAGEDNPFPTGSLVGRKKYDGPGTTGQWQTFEARMDRETVTIKLDGNEIMQYSDPSPAGRGFIGLQHNKGKVEFRNVKLKPLRTASLFDGKSLDGWKEYPNMASRFSVTDDGELNVKDGRGQLESSKSFGDFVLQLECISYAKALNSGIFFRCIPGDEMMGYECQIQNGFKDDDRTKPEDCGTGGFFRRQNARRVVADDNEWFYETLIVEGPHMAAWVNGIQVSDWTDKRKPHKNPRKGLRKEPGTLMIQGHDPTTNLSFRDIRAGEMEVRRPK